MDGIGFWISIWIVANLFAVGVYDLYVLLLTQEGYGSVSYYLSSWSRQYPVVTFAAGVIVGHLLWQVRGAPKAN